MLSSLLTVLTTQAVNGPDPWVSSVLSQRTASSFHLAFYSLLLWPRVEAFPRDHSSHQQTHWYLYVTWKGQFSMPHEHVLMFILPEQKLGLHFSVLSQCLQQCFVWNVRTNKYLRNKTEIAPFYHGG